MLKQWLNKNTIESILVYEKVTELPSFSFFDDANFGHWNSVLSGVVECFSKLVVLCSCSIVIFKKELAVFGDYWDDFFCFGNVHHVSIQ